MKLAPLLLLAMLAPAGAQERLIPFEPQPTPYTNFPKVVQLHNKETGETIGTITLNGRDAYFRDRKGVHLQTITTEADGSHTVYDPSGNIIKTVPKSQKE